MDDHHTGGRCKKERTKIAVVSSVKFPTCLSRANEAGPSTKRDFLALVLLRFGTNRDDYSLLIGVLGGGGDNG